jgi:tRNA dimethylallyltransferase
MRSNLRRVIRALEVYEATSVPMSAQEGKGPPPYDALEIGLFRPRDELFRIIDRRVAHRSNAGLSRRYSGYLEPAYRQMHQLCQALAIGNSCRTWKAI